MTDEPNQPAPPTARPGTWREAGGFDDLVILDVPAQTLGMVVVARASEDWARRPELRWQAWPDLLTPNAKSTG